jgi:sialate O-acetylesterase
MKSLAPRGWFCVVFLWLAILLPVAAARADVKLPAVFGDHMVVQQQMPVTVWGWADPGEKVSVKLADRAAAVTAGGDGKWRATLDPVSAGGPFELSVAGKNNITLKNVLVGEVWICSGQSNMEWSVLRSANPQEEAAAAEYPRIRLFTVAKNVAAQPQDDCKGAWAACSPQSVGGFSAVGYYFGREIHKETGAPVGLINTSWGGTICEAWTSREALEADKDFAPILARSATFAANQPNQASVLYNGMIHPLAPFGFRGALWYQGESNVGRAEQYRKLFPAMIADWRRQWGQGDFPFLYVQLAPYAYGNGAAPTLAEQWESQLKTLSVPNTGMAVTTDIGDVKDIHPKNKQEVGRRLALWALAKTYGKSGIVYSGPLFKSAQVEGDKIRVSFTHAGGGLVAREGKPLTHFTIAGADEEFVPATATIDGDTIVVHSPDVPKPVAVRFGWRNDAEPNLFNKEGLPASPFRSDTFKLTTAGKL